MRRLIILLPILALACGQKSLDLQAAPHITPSTDPTVVGTIDEQVGPIAVDDERLYWMGTQGQFHHGGANPIGGRALRSCEKRDCSRSLVTYDSGDAESAGAFGVQDGQIYWFHYSAESPYHPWSILACDVSGCGSGPRTVVAHVELYPDVVGYASDAIYLDLSRIPLSGNTAPVAVATFPELGLEAFGIHGDYLYWAERQPPPGPPLSPKPAPLRRARTSGDTPPETLAESVEIFGYPYAGRDPYPSTSTLVFDSSYVYWNQGTLDGEIDRCPLAGCSGAPEVVVAPIRWPLVVVVDGSKVYWLHDSSAQGFQVSSCTIGDCASPDLVASALAGSNVLAIDDQYLYSATSDRALDPDLTWNNPVAQIRRFLK